MCRNFGVRTWSALRGGSLGGEGRGRLGWREALFDPFVRLGFPQRRPELHAGEGRRRGVEEGEPRQRARAPSDGAMIRCHRVMPLFHLSTADGRPVCLVRAPDGLGEEARGRPLSTLLGQG